MTHFRALMPILLLASVAHAFGAERPVDDVQIEFTVEKSDTLIGLTREVLVSAAAWREVSRLNRLPNPNLIYPGQVLRIPTRLLRGTPRTALLLSSTGDVRIGDAAVTSAATSGTPISDGQTVQTAAGSSAVVELADGSRVRVPPSSLAQVMGSTSYGARPANGGPAGAAGASVGWLSGALRVLRGSVEVVASKVLRAKPLEVVTPTAVVGVRGTQFRVGIDDANGSTHAEVIEGRTRVDALSRAAGADVSAGFGAVVDARGTPPRAAKLLDAPDLSGVPARFEAPLVRFDLPGQSNWLRVQVAADSAVDRIVSDQRFEPGTDVRIAGLDDAEWHLRARRIDEQGIEGFDAVRPFVLKARPEPPAYRSPRADAKQTVGSVEFAWARNATAPQAHLQLAEDAAFTRLIQDQGSVPDSPLRTELKDAGTYFWRLASVRADGDQGPYGAVQKFELRPMPQPPTGGLSADGRGMVFRWSGRAQDRQEVQLASDAAFTQIVAQAVLDSAEWSVPTPSSSGRYHFRYRSIEPDGFTSPHSETLEIQVPVDWTPLWLLAPLLLLF